MWRPWALIHGVVWPLSVVGLSVNRLVGSNVCVAEEIAGWNDDATERGEVIDGSEAILRSLGVVRRQVPLSIAALRVYPRRVGLLHERIPILRRADDLLVVLAEVEVLFVVEEEVVSESGSSPTLSFSESFDARAHWV